MGHAAQDVTLQPISEISNRLLAYSQAKNVCHCALTRFSSVHVIERSIRYPLPQNRSFYSSPMKSSPETASSTWIVLGANRYRFEDIPMV